MYNWKLSSVNVAKGCKLTVTLPVDLKSIFDFLNITDFFITDYNGFFDFLLVFDIFEDEKSLDALIIRCAVFGSLMGT